MKKLWKWICSLFTREQIGAIWRTIFTSAISEVAKMVCDPVNQQAALTFVRNLAKAEMSNADKTKEFNRQMAEWAKRAGVKLTTVAINALRENAVVALKCEDCHD